MGTQMHEKVNSTHRQAKPPVAPKPQSSLKSAPIPIPHIKPSTCKCQNHMGLIFNIVFTQWNISAVSVLPSFPLLPPHINFSHNRAKLVKWSKPLPLFFRMFYQKLMTKITANKEFSRKKKKTTISKEYQNNVWTPASVNLLRNQRMNSSKKKNFCISQALLIHAFILLFPFFSFISVLVLQPCWVHPISPMGVKQCCYWHSCKAGLSKHRGSLTQ